MNLPDPGPKDSREDLYGRTEQLASLLGCIRDREPLVVISGLRRTGKTSLVRTAMATIENGIFVDASALGTKKTVNRENVWNLFDDPIRMFLNRHRSKMDQLSGFINSVSGISVGFAGGGVQFSRSNTSKHHIVSLFNALNAWGVENDQTIVLAVDEAQEFARATDVDLAKIFSAFYSYKNIVTIMTGSKIGLLYDFVRKDDPDGAFYGRGRTEMVLDPPSPEESRDFLSKALAGVRRTAAQAKARTDSEAVAASDTETLKEAADKLGGIPGRLVEFGRLCEKNGGIRREFIEKVRQEGSVQIKGEFCSFLDRNGLQRNRYEMLVRMLASSSLRHDEFERRLQEDGLADCAARLAVEGFLKKDEGGRYYFPDPLLAYAYRGKTS